MNYYGQNLEDQIVSDYFKAHHGQDFTGTVLDLGANDGITLSNSRHFYENGWDLVLVEAGNKTCERLYELYMYDSPFNVLIANFAIGKKGSSGTLKFYESEEMLRTGDTGLVSTLVESETERWVKAGVRFTTHEVPVKDWDTIYKEVCEIKFKDKLVFDFISIDIEGLDYDVMIQMDLTALKCKCLCVEFNGKEKEKYVSYAQSHGMQLYHENAENLIFVK
jgi:FkbM family methyltransferase